MNGVLTEVSLSLMHLEGLKPADLTHIGGALAGLLAIPQEAVGQS